MSAEELVMTDLEPTGGLIALLAPSPTRKVMA